MFDDKVCFDNINGSFYLCYLLLVLIIIIKSGVICISVHLYIIIMCKDGMVVYLCLCIILVTSVVTVVHTHICGYFKVIDKYCITVCIS